MLDVKVTEKLSGNHLSCITIAEEVCDTRGFGTLV